MSMVEPQIAHCLMIEIQKIEAGTDLKRVAIIARTGMAIASAKSDQLDADAETGSSAALIDLAERLSNSVNHGNLREIIVKSESGFVILQFINSEYMVFGGISNPLKIGYYMEYLRHKAIYFAYILAGNQLTDELKQEIEATKEREQKIQEEKHAPLSANFKMDKDMQSDMDAMKGVLDFLKDWGEEGTETKPSADNIVSIDKDILFGMENLAPTPISQDQVDSARGKSEEIESSNQGTKASSVITNQKSPVEQPTSDFQDVGLPADILASLDEISGTSSSVKIKQDVQKSKVTESSPYGIPIYKGEVPPVPLEDYVTFEVGSFTAGESHSANESSGSDDLSGENAISPKKVPTKTDGSPDFDAVTSEYDDPDLSIEEDAMLDALNELGMSSEKPTSVKPISEKSKKKR